VVKYFNLKNTRRNYASTSPIKDIANMDKDASIFIRMLPKINQKTDAKPEAILRTPTPKPNKSFY